MRRLLIAVWLLIALAGSLSGSRACALTDDSQAWVSITGMGPLSQQSAYGAYFEFQIRHSEDQKRLFQTFIRPAIYWQLNEKLSVWMGVLSLRKYNFSETEQRLWQQVLFSDKLDVFSYSLRLRQEQRFYKEPEDEKGAQHKTRLQLRVVGPPCLKVKPVIWDELHWNWNSSSHRSEVGYDQNRVFLGVTAEIAEAMHMDFGYMNANFKRLGLEDLSVNSLSTTLLYRW